MRKGLMLIVSFQMSWLLFKERQLRNYVKGECYETL